MITKIEVEGLDRTGKDTLVGYLDYLSGRTLSVGSRGLLSVCVYGDMFNRFHNVKPDVFDSMKNTLIVFLTANDEDLNVRCKMSNEPDFDILEHSVYFHKWADIFEEHGITILRYNTSVWTPYRIAKDVLRHLNTEEKWYEN